ncbi:hypothetical protein [Sphingopyxis sp. BSNA05]|nr:hypothetical protein [Sphingopyxis sp. BSNA05]
MSEEDLLENYRRAYNNKVGFGDRPALLMIDFARAISIPTAIYIPM